MNKREFMRRRALKAVVLAVVLALAVSPVPAFAAFSVNGGAPDGVTQEMTQAQYWADRAVTDADKVLMTPAEINQRNQQVVDTSGVSTYDMAHFDTLYGSSYNADNKRRALANITIPTRSLYIDGNLINNQEYYTNIKNAILETGYTGTSYPDQYAVCTTFAPVKSIPTDDVVGYSAADPDDEVQSAALLVNDPFVIRQKCDIGGETYYYGYAADVDGWVNSKNLAICADKGEWLDSWHVETDGKNFLVVTADKIVLEPSYAAPYSSKLTLTVGTVLKLVPDSRIPKLIGERGPWFTYVVYIPTRTDDGKYKKEVTQIAMHYDVSVGYLPLTQANLLHVAFNCLGNRYGWGQMLESMDCSTYVRNIYKCCGLYMERNTTWQRKTAGTEISFANLTDEEKVVCLAGMPACTPVYFTGHAMLYTGTVDGMSYVISDTGTISDRVGALDARKMYSVIINPLDVRRASGLTWLTTLEAAVVWPFITRINECEITVKAAEGKTGAAVTVKYDGETLKEGRDYVLLYPEAGIVSVIGRADYVGIERVEIPGGGSDEPDDFFGGVIKLVENLLTKLSTVILGPDTNVTGKDILKFLWNMALAFDIIR